MIIGKVVGTVYSTIHHPFFGRYKLMMVEKIKPDGSPASSYVIAVDQTGSGIGETVLIVDEGNGARQILQSADGPVRSVIVGIVDQINKETTP